MKTDGQDQLESDEDYKKSKFNMAFLNFRRYHRIFEKADEFSILINSGTRNIKIYRAQYAVLRQLYINFAPWIMTHKGNRLGTKKERKDKSKELENCFILSVKQIKNIEQRESTMKNFPYISGRGEYHNEIEKIYGHLSENLSKINEEIVRIQQIIGMGLPEKENTEIEVRSSGRYETDSI